jgi:hypothetical protein
MTDPSIAALAEALSRTSEAGPQGMATWPERWADALLADPEFIAIFADERFAAWQKGLATRIEEYDSTIASLRAAADGIPLLLADITERDAEIARLREQNYGLYAAVQMGANEQDRLRAELDAVKMARDAYATAGRKIEEAARAHIAWVYRMRGAPRFTMTNLRAALGEGS